MPQWFYYQPVHEVPTSKGLNMKLNISSAFIISGTPFIAQCAYFITAMPTRCSFTEVYVSVTDSCMLFLFLKR